MMSSMDFGGSTVRFVAHKAPDARNSDVQDLQYIHGVVLPSRR
jgi:hypothetical protein